MVGCFDCGLRVSAASALWIPPQANGNAVRDLIARRTVHGAPLELPHQEANDVVMGDDQDALLGTEVLDNCRLPIGQEATQYVEAGLSGRQQSGGNFAISRIALGVTTV